MEDCVDAYTVAKACQHFGLTSIEGKPTVNAPPVLLEVRSDQAKCMWLLEQAKAVRKELLSPESEQQATELDHMAEKAMALDNKEQFLQTTKQDNGKFKCTYCGKVYVRERNFTKHLTKVHSQTVDLDTAPADIHQLEGSSEDVSRTRTVVASFCRMGYLHRDTEDAYKMADGDRIFRNAKLDMLYAWSLKHTKYRLWLWNMLAYEMALLTPSEAFDYKWNTCTNLQGGIGKNIPNDNAVEIQVGEIKKMMQRAGSNKSFEVAQTICKTNQIVGQIAKNLQDINKGHVSSKERPAVRKLQDIKTMVEEVLESKILDSASTCKTFPQYRDPLARLDMGKFHSWVKEKKEIAAIEMVRNAHLRA